VNLASDLETNYYAFRDGYEIETSFFLKRTIEDNIDRLTQLADRLSPKTTNPIALVGGTLIDVTGKPPISNSVIIIEGDRIVISGEERIELRCGLASIILEKDGRVTIRGTQLTSQASGTNRIRGGAVHLN